MVSNRLLTLYHHMPYSLRVLIASVQGYRLRRMRYTRETERLVHEALGRETWTTEQWRTYQEERLARLLHRAATRVPYYRAYWQHRRRQGDRASWDVLANWPLLPKYVLQTYPESLIADDCDRRKMYHEATSGTSGKPAHIWLSRRAIREWYALFEARLRRWNGLSLRDHWALLGGKVITPFWQEKPPFWVWNNGMHQLYLSSYHLTPHNAAAYIEAMQRYGVRSLIGYTSSIYSLALGMLTHGLQPPPLAVILTNSEPLYSYQRETIAEAFGCPVRNTYGMVEVVCGATECDHGSLHHWPETGVIEVLQDESSQPVPIGQSGRFVCTGLLNTDMPLIRYQFGDRGALARADSVCGCGRTLPGIARIDGREADLLLTPDGRRLWGEAVTDRFNEYAFPIDGVQLVQERIEAVRVCIVPRASYTARDGERIIAMLRERLGNMQIDLELIDAIPRTANGKVLALVNKMPNGQVQQLVSAPQSEQKE